MCLCKIEKARIEAPQKNSKKSRGIYHHTITLVAPRECRDWERRKRQLNTRKGKGYKMDIHRILKYDHVLNPSHNERNAASACTALRAHPQFEKCKIKWMSNCTGEDGWEIGQLIPQKVTL